MNLSASILGSTAVKQLQASTSAWVLEVGSDKLTRGQLASVGCYNFHAARLLTACLRTLPVKNLAELFAKFPPSAVALPHLGVISLAVLGAAFEAKGIGGASPLEAWVQKHAPGGAEAEMVTFHTMKRRELAEGARERKLTRRRRHAA